MVKFKMKRTLMLLGAVCVTSCILLYINCYYPIQYASSTRGLSTESDRFYKSLSKPNSLSENAKTLKTFLFSTTAVPQSKIVYLESILKDSLADSRINALTNDSQERVRFSERRTHLVNACRRKYNESSSLSVSRDKLDHILVDEKHKVLFCYVPKVACTNWKRIFMLLTGKATNLTHATSIPSYEIHEKSLFPTLQNYTTDKINFFIQNYTKYIFVRNPFERLLSAYHNKLEQHYNSSKYFQARFGKLIVKKFRPNATNVSLAKGDDVTFAEFVSYLVSTEPEAYNEHWQSVSNLCHPCFIPYHVIGKYEVLPEDSKSIINMLLMNNTFPPIPKPSKTAASLQEYYKQVPQSFLARLIRIYEMDFRLFNYSTKVNGS